MALKGITLHCRITKRHYKHLRRKANNAQKNISEYLRELIEEDLLKEERIELKTKE